MTQTGQSAGASLSGAHPTIANLKTVLADNNGLIILAHCTGTPDTTASTYQHGAIMIQTDSGTGTNGIYQNTGSSASPVWSLLDTGTAFALPTTSTDAATTTTTSFSLTNTAITTGVGTLMAHTTSVIASGGSNVRISSTSVDTGTTTGNLLDLSSTASTAGTQVLGTFSALTTGIGVSIVTAALTAGNAISVTANAITTSNVISVTSTSAVYTSGNLISASLTSSSATLATAAGAIASLAYSITGTATSGTVSPTNNALLVSATYVQNGAGGTLAPSGAIVQITGVSTQTAGTLTDTRTGIGITVPSGMTGAPIFVTQGNVTSTHFKKILQVASGPTLWMSDGNTPNGALSGTAGDICFNGASSRSFYCTGTTSWTASNA